MKLSAEDLRLLMKTMFPDPDIDGHSEHPLDAIGVVLLAAGIFIITDPEALARLTGYPRAFISAILFNLHGNKAFANGFYDCSDWLSSNGTINGTALWDHIEAAWGNLWLEEVDFDPLDACQIYRNHKELS
jgi:hypothetical protein